MLSKKVKHPNGGDLTAAVAAIREQRPAWAEQRRQAERAPVDRATAEARLEQEIASAARVGAYVHGGTLASPMYDPRARVGGLLSYRDPAAIGGDPRRLLTAALCGLMPDVVRQVGRAAIAEHYRDGDGIPDAERAARLAEIDRQLAALERDEERMIRAADRDGQTIARRDDADPAVVLAPDAALEGDALPSSIDLARYWTIRDQAAALRAALHAAGDRRDLARTEHQRAAQRLAAAEQLAPSRRAEVPPELRALAEQRTQTLDRYQAVYDAARDAWQTAIRIATACREYAEAHGCDVREPGEATIEPGAMSPVATSTPARPWS